MTDEVKPALNRKSRVKVTGAPLIVPCFVRLASTTMILINLLLA